MFHWALFGETKKCLKNSISKLGRAYIELHSSAKTSSKNPISPQCFCTIGGTIQGTIFPSPEDHPYAIPRCCCSAALALATTITVNLATATAMIPHSQRCIALALILSPCPCRCCCSPPLLPLLLPLCCPRSPSCCCSHCQSCYRAASFLAAITVAGVFLTDWYVAFAVTSAIVSAISIQPWGNMMTHRDDALDLRDLSGKWRNSHVLSPFSQCVLSNDSLMRSNQGNFWFFLYCEQLILLDLMSNPRHDV